MAKISIKNANKPAPVWATKLAASCATAGATIAGYGLTQEDKIVGYMGLGLAVLGSVLPLWFKNEEG